MTVNTSASRTARLMADLRKTALFHQVVPMEAGIGWPIPVRHRPGWDGAIQVYMRLPLYGFRRDGTSGVTHLFPPFSMLTLRWPTGQVVEFADFRYTRPWPAPTNVTAVGTFPHDAVLGSVSEYTTDRERLLGLYDDLLDGLQTQRPFAGQAEFTLLLRKLAEPALVPYYRALGPRFFDQFLGPGPSEPVQPPASPVTETS
jgi:hypothetical protein